MRACTWELRALVFTHSVGAGVQPPRAGAGGGGYVNLADGEFDEAAAHTSFMEAVSEWRTGHLAVSGGSPGRGARGVG